MSANIDEYQWNNRPQVPGSLTQRICVTDRGGNLYKWDATSSDWTIDASPAVAGLSSVGQIAPGALPATALAAATVVLTGGNTNGSLTIVNGIVTAYVAPT